MSEEALPPQPVLSAMDVNTPLPEFERPPVTEVAVAIQFETLEGLTNAHLGIFWSRIRDQLPGLEIRPPRGPSIETFEVPSAVGERQVQVELVTEQPVGRYRFLSEGESELIQIQSDRFVFNWRKREEDQEYPRFEHIRGQFRRYLSLFRQFLDDEDLPTVRPNQAEISYVNHLFSGEGWREFAQIGKIIPSWQVRYSDDFLSIPEDIRFRIRYLIPDNEDDAKPIGRLYIVVEPGYRESDPALLMRLTARGGVSTDMTLEDAHDFIERGREWIVRGFTSITSEHMHKIWRRKDDY